VIAYKFLAAGAVSPFTGFRWPGAGEWVTAPAREEAWIHACRRADVPYWLDDELWAIELDGPIRESRYQIAAGRARLVAGFPAWNSMLRREYARACAFRARHLALPHLPASLRSPVRETDDLQGIAAAVQRTTAPPALGGYLSDVAGSATRGDAAEASYIACVVASVVGDGLAAFDAERAWQARWLGERLPLSA
jgi:hypothetical protein